LRPSRGGWTMKITRFSVRLRLDIPTGFSFSEGEMEKFIEDKLKHSGLPITVIELDAAEVGTYEQESRS
jgi:hypothetical protein